MICLSKMQTVKGEGIGEESVIGRLVKYQSYRSFSAPQARIALIDGDDCGFDTLFEISQEFMGFVRVSEFDKDIADMAEELRLVGLFCEDEKKLCGAMNEMVIILPKKNRAILAPDIKALANFESTLLSREKNGEELTLCNCGLSRRYKKDLNKIKKYFQNS